MQLPPSSYRMQAAGSPNGTLHGRCSVTAHPVGYWQVLRNEFSRRDGGKRAHRGIAGLFSSIRTGTRTRSLFQSLLPCCFLTGYTHGFFAPSPAAFQSGSRLSVLRLEPRCELRIYSTQPCPPVGLTRRAQAAVGGRAADSATRAALSFSTLDTSGPSESTDRGRKYPSALGDGRDVVELKGEVVPSRVKGPLSRFSVCLLHGLLGSRRNLRTIGSCLASPRVVAFDLRNHGQSPWRETMSIDDLARDVLYTLHERTAFLQPQYAAGSLADSSKALLSSLNFTKTTEEPPLDVVLIGHSLGGLTAMRAATLAASDAINQCCSTSRLAFHIAGIVVLDIAPIDYTTTSEQERLRAHQRKTGTPGVETIVQVLADLPMHLFENRKQLEKALRTATSPSLSPGIISWLMTGVQQSTVDDFSERVQTRTVDGARGKTTADIYHREKPSKNVDPDSRPRSQSKTTTLRWQTNIHAVSRMLASKQLGWRLTDCPVQSETEQVSYGRQNEVFQNQPWLPTGKPPETTVTNAAYSSHGSSGNQDVACSVSRSLPVTRCGAYSGPTLFLKGSESPYIDVEKHWDETLRVFPNAECKVVPGAGHWLHADKPQLTAEYINNFLLTI